ncbi:phage tail protein [Paenibacillus sp. FSL L8-0506]|uniref:phage tail protein n=1 Tax=Paenibacillus sp. FSL L8-0506 TaxID=2975335 RepID=UPI0030F60ACC
MLGDIDYSKRFRKIMHLAKPNKQLIDSLTIQASKVNLQTKLDEVNELTFRIPYFVEENNIRTKNKTIDIIKTDFLVLLTLENQLIKKKDKHWFRITSLSDAISDTEYLEVTALSLEFELAGHNISRYEVESKGGITVLNEILKDVKWEVGTYDPDFEISKRAFTFNDTTLLDAVNECANTYNAIVDYDTDKRIINLYKPEFHGVATSFPISDKNLLKGFNRKKSSEDAVTKLKPIGKDGLDISSVSTSGTPYIEDYSYYMFPFERDEHRNVIESSYYMSDSLCHALLDFQELSTSKNGEYEKLKIEFDKYTSNITTKSAELVKLINQKKGIDTLVSNYSVNGLSNQNIPLMFFDTFNYLGSSDTRYYDTLVEMNSYAALIKVDNATGIQINFNGVNKIVFSDTWVVLGKVKNVTSSSIQIIGGENTNIQIQFTAINDTEFESTDNNSIIERYSSDNKQMQINAKTIELNAEKSNLSVINGNIDTLYNQLSSESNFTPDQLYELADYIKEKDFRAEQYVDAKDLMKAGREKFDEIMSPEISLDVDIVDLFSSIDLQWAWEHIWLGNYVIVSYRKLGVKTKAKIIEMNYDFDEPSIKLTLANAKDVNDDTMKWQKWQNRQSKTSTVVENNKNQWTQAIVDNSEFSKLFDNFYDKTTNQINMAINQSVKIDERGITVTQQDDPLRFLRITNGAIGITKSGSAIFETAINADGVIAPSLYGKIILSQRVTVGDINGIWMMEGPKTTITDRYGRVAMKLGLYEENPDLFGMVINRYDGIKADSTLINKVIANSEDGFKIQRFNGHSYDDKFYVDNDGLLFAEDMTTKRLKIVSDQNELMLDSYTKQMNIGKFTEIITDGKLTGIEKLQVLGEKTRIMSEYTKLLDQANSYKTTSRDSKIVIDILPFTTAYNALISYLNPLLTEMTITSDINRDEFIQKFKTYYDAVVTIVNAINDSIKYSSVQLGSLYNNVLIDSLEGITATRSDFMYRSMMNATKGFAIQKNTNTADSPVWVDQFWADTQGIVHAEGIKVNNSLFTDGDITGGNINGSSLTLRDGHGGIMKMYPELGFWAGINAELPTDAPSWIKPNGEATFKKLIVKNGVDGGLMIDSENKYIDFNAWDLKGAGAVDAKLLSAVMVSADLGYISDIIANSLSTMNRTAISGWSNFIEVKDKTVQWITGHVTQGEHISVNGKPMYWVESSETGVMTTDVTAWPVYKYLSDDSNKKVKMEAGFKGEGAAATPYWRMGEGDNGLGNSAIYVMDKYNGGLKQRYGSSNYDKERSIDLKDSGTYINADSGLVQITSKDITVTVDSGIVKIGDTSGGVIEVANGVITLKGSKINFEAGEYNFN